MRVVFEGYDIGSAIRQAAVEGRCGHDRARLCSVLWLALFVLLLAAPSQAQPIPGDFDLALRKTLSAGQSSTVQPGDDVSYTIEVFNQGRVTTGLFTATNVELTDTFPPGFDLSSNDTNGWVQNGTTATVTLPQSIPIQTSTSIEIVLTATSPPLGTATNFAEISSAADQNGQLRLDKDSFYDAISGNTPGEVLPVMVDDEILQDGKQGGDEDDHDFATVTVEPPPVFDLALAKGLATGQAAVVQTGDDVTYTVTVYNQGDIDAANIELTDTLPTGFALSPADTNGWAGSGSTVTATLAGTLAAGGTTSIDLVLEVTPSATVGAATNFAEISAATDASGGAVVDIDSTPDTVSGNTPGEVPPALEDNQINEDGTQPGQDEDDHDLEEVEVAPTAVFDLALRKVFANGPTAPNSLRFAEGNVDEDVEYEITVFNQGEVDARDIQIFDTPPSGFSLSPLDSTGWTAAGSGLTLTIPGPLAPGAEVTVGLILRFNRSTAGTFDNFAEISSATDGAGNPVTDVDSTPDATSGNQSGEGPPALEDDQINEDGTQPGQDEDDHDLARTEVLPVTDLLALGNVVWLDSNNNGTQDGGESGIEGVSVRILDDAGGPVNPFSLASPEQILTDANGGFEFFLLDPGTYTIEVEASNFAGGGPLQGLLSSTGALQENDPNADVDFNDNGVDDPMPEVNGIRSNPIVLAFETEPLGEPGGSPGPLDENSNLTVDFGFGTGGVPAIPGLFGWGLMLFAGLLGWIGLRTLRNG